MYTGVLPACPRCAGYVPNYFMSTVVLTCSKCKYTWSNHVDYLTEVAHSINTGIKKSEEYIEKTMRGDLEALVLNTKMDIIKSLFNDISDYVETHQIETKQIIEKGGLSEPAIQRRHGQVDAYLAILTLLQDYISAILGPKSRSKDDT